ncbi:hypothetical protein E2320_014736 [Naja naja]|nr:hypothetical protein E2320_014736 [Naja naja]
MELPQVAFEEVAVHFTEQEWALLNVGEKVLYKDVMQENFEHVMSLGILLALKESKIAPCLLLVTPYSSSMAFHQSLFIRVGSVLRTGETEGKNPFPWQFMSTDLKTGTRTGYYTAKVDWLSLSRLPNCAAWHGSPYRAKGRAVEVRLSGLLEEPGNGTAYGNGKKTPELENRVQLEPHSNLYRTLQQVCPQSSPLEKCLLDWKVSKRNPSDQAQAAPVSGMGSGRKERTEEPGTAWFPERTVLTIALTASFGEQKALLMASTKLAFALN